MARSKRANGGESVYRDASRKRWVGVITVGSEVVGSRTTADGREVPKYRLTRRKVSGRTQAEVRERLAELRAELATTAGEITADAPMSVYLTHWLDQVLPLGSTTQSTDEHYSRMVRLYLVPMLGDVRLSDLSPAHVRALLASMRERGLSAATQRLALACLRRALRTAESDGLITKNPARLVDGVRQERSQGRTLTPADARALLKAAQGHEHETLITLLLSLGLRRGEALALSWDDVQLDREPATLTVRRSLKKDASGRLYASEPKTAGSRRTIHLPASLVESLRRHRAGHVPSAGRWEADRLVFTNSVGGAVDPDRFARSLGALTEGAGLGRWTPHELRHSAASLLIAANVPIKTVSDLLGHSSIRVTADVYGHLLEPARTDAASAMERTIF